MVAIKLIVASLASLAVAHPIEARSPDLGSALNDLVGNLGNTVGSLLNHVLNFDGSGIADDVTGVLGQVDNVLNNVVGEVDSASGGEVGDVVEKTGLGNIVDQLLASVDKIQQELLNSPLADSLLATLKSLLGGVTSLKNSIPSTGATSDVAGKLGKLEDSLNGIVNQANQS